MTSRIAILISGRGSNMLALVDAAHAGRIPGAEIALVISDRADARGLELARERRMETIVIERSEMTRSMHEARTINALREHKINLVCLAGFMRLLTSEFVEIYRGRILNIHPSLLPAFPGLHPHRQALEYGVRISGCTVHFVDETTDGGAIIEQRAVPVYDDDTEETLAARILVVEHKIYPEAVARVVQGHYRTTGRRIIHTEPFKKTSIGNTA
jgi:phosphoribosylglycinamide formyltransferase-1